MGQIGKTENRIEYQIRKPVSILRENRKPNALIRKIRKPQRPPNRKTEVFLAQKPKNRSKKLPKPQNRKSRCPSPLIRCLHRRLCYVRNLYFVGETPWAFRGDPEVAMQGYHGDLTSYWYRKDFHHTYSHFTLIIDLLYFVIVTFLLIDARPVWVNRFYDFIFCTRITPSATKNTV